MAGSGKSRAGGRRFFPWWMLAFLGFPLGGLLALMVVGPVDLMWVCVTGILMWRLVPRLAIDGDTVNGHDARRGNLAKNEQEFERD